MLAGTVEHGDSLGNRGTLGAGDVQWMTAGSGILHQEMPQGDAQGRMHGFQLWANLPSSLKMTAPRYQDVAGADIPEVVDDDGTRGARRLRRVLGQDAARSTASPPTRAISTSRCRPASARRLPVETDAPRLRLRLRGLRHVPRRLGAARRADRERVDGSEVAASASATGNRSLVLFDRGDEVTVQAGDEGIRFLLVSGKPIEEPVAWYGPIVMNTQAELQQAVRRAAQRHVHQAPLISGR